MVTSLPNSYEPQVPPAPETPPSWKRSQFCPFIAELHAPGKISTVNPQTQVITWVPILSSAAVFVLIWDCGINESLSKFILFINFFIFLNRSELLILKIKKYFNILNNRYYHIYKLMINLQMPKHTLIYIIPWSGATVHLHSYCYPTFFTRTLGASTPLITLNLQTPVHVLQLGRWFHELSMLP
jgi:hypothetical protein